MGIVQDINSSQLCIDKKKMKLSYSNIINHLLTILFISDMLGATLFISLHIMEESEVIGVHHFSRSKEYKCMIVEPEQFFLLEQHPLICTSTSPVPGISMLKLLCNQFIHSQYRAYHTIIRSTISLRAPPLKNAFTLKKIIIL